jgi:lipoate-protein ligase A
MNKKRILSHGTLMVDVNIENMLGALNVDDVKIQSKAITSVKSRVANLRDYLGEGFAIEDFRTHLINSFFEGMDIETFEIDENLNNTLEERVKAKFSTWQHNFGSSPPFSMSKRRKFDSGIVEIGLNISGGKIAKAKFSGDFFVNSPIEELEEKLIGLELSEESLQAQNGLDTTISGFGKNDLIRLIFS